jgi:Na+/melibiose symporter-like transporter
VVVRWGLGLSCLAIEVAIVVIVIDACVRVIGADQLFFWHPVLLTIGAILFLSHGALSVHFFFFLKKK